MNIITGYTGTKHITSDMDRDIHIGAFGSGSYVLPTGSMLAAEVASNNEIRVRDGVILHQGCAASIKKNTYDSLTVVNGSQGMNRADLIVARYQKNADSGIESLDLVVLRGTPAEGTPEDPDYTNGDIQSGDYVADMPMYRVKLEGLNIVAVEPMFQVLMSMKELQDQADELNSKLNDDRIGFPDYAKTIGTYTNTGFTAPENCWAKIESTSGWSSTTLNVNGNGVIIQQIKNTDSYPIRTSVMIPLKKGDVVTMSSSTSVNGITAVLYPMR